jgi:hypothetical protein
VERVQPQRERVWWMTALALFCALTVVFTLVRDLALPEVRDVEVWLGFEVRGDAALATAPLHWAIFAVGAWAFWTQRPWILPWAAAYVFYVALSHLVWSEASPHGRGWPMGLAQAAGISVFGLLLLRARRSAALRSLPEASS